MSNPLNGTRPVFVKTVSVLTSVATMLSLSGAAYLAPLAANAAVPSDYGLTEGNMISATGSNDPDVYIVNAWGYKRLFLNPAIFAMYGQLSGGWASVKSVSAAARDAFPTTLLFRNCETNAQAVYAVQVTGEDTATLHHVVMSGDAAVAQDSQFFKKVFCVNSTEQNWYGALGSDYTSLSQIQPYVRGGVNNATPTPNYGPLSVSLASDNPSGGTLISGTTSTDGQARADLAHFMFSGSGTVTSLRLNRLGVSADAVLNNVYLYDGTKRLTDAATVSNGVVSFNDAGGLFTVSGSRTISVKADILYGNSGQTVGVQLTNWNGNAVSISGNLFSLATATLATVTLSASVTPSTDGTPAPQSDFVAWQDAVTVGSRNVWLNSVQYRVVGSVQPGDLQNFRLFVDGVQQGNAVASTDANGYIVFDMSGSPINLQTGSRTLKVLVNIINGSGRNFYLSLRQKSDIWVVDSQYAGASVLATGTFPVSSTAQTVGQGTVTVVKTPDSPSGDVVKGASGVTLARFKITAAGERMKFESIRVSNTSAPNLALRNGTLFVDDGLGGPMTQIGSTQTIWNSVAGAASASANAYTEYSLGSSLIVDPLYPRTLEIRADIYDASGTDNTATGNTIVANIVAGASNVQRLTELDYPSVPYAAAPGNTLTIRTGTLSAAKYTGYANQSVVSPASGIKIGSYTLTSASSESVNINTLNFDLTSTLGTLTSDFTNAYVKVWNDTGSLVLTSTIKTTLSATASNSFAVNFVLPANKTYQVELWANVASTFAAGADVLTTNFDASGVTTGSSTTANAVQVTGQTITSANGNLGVANGAIPPARLINGGQTASTYSFTLTPTYDNYTLDEVYVDIANPSVASNSGAVATLYLKNASGTVLASAPLNGTTGSASFTGLNLSLPQSGGTQTFTVDVAFSNVGVGANDTGGSVTMQLDGLKYRNGGGTSTTVNGLATASYTGNAFYDVKGYPTFANASLPSTVLSPGTFQTIFKTVLSANGGQISWNNITFTTASNSAAGTFGPTNTGWKLYENGTDITSFATAASVSDIGSTTRVEFTFATERAVAVGSPVTLELKTTSGATIATSDYLTTQITNPNTTTVTTYSSTVQQKKGPSFVWSDQSAPSHGTATDDWFTDGMVTGLVQSETVTK